MNLYIQIQKKFKKCCWMCVCVLLLFDSSICVYIGSFLLCLPT